MLKRNQAEKLAQKALKAGASEAELFLVQGRKTTVKVFSQQIDSLEQAETSGAGLRVIVDGATGYAFSSELSSERLDLLAKEAVGNARVAKPDPYAGLPEVPKAVPSLSLYFPEVAETPTEKKIEITLGLEKAALERDKRITGAEYVLYADEEKEIGLANSKGFWGSYSASDCYLYLSLMAEEKSQVQTGRAFAAARKPEDLDFEKVGKEAADKALSLLGAEPIASREAAMIFDSLVAAEFFAVAAAALSAEAAQKGRSLFAGKVGKKVGSSVVNLIDDGTLPQGLASAPFDGEGVPTQRTELIKEGVLQGFMHNTYTARKGGVSSTGNAGRHSYAGPPEVAPSNFFLQPGRKSGEELVRELEQGLYVLELQGVHAGANPISGEFSVGAVGLWMEKGEIVHAVRGITIAGRMLEMLEAIEEIADDIRFVPMGAYFGAPTIRIGSMTISGK